MYVCIHRYSPIHACIYTNVFICTCAHRKLSSCRHNRLPICLCCSFLVYLDVHVGKHIIYMYLYMYMQMMHVGLFVCIYTHADDGKVSYWCPLSAWPACTPSEPRSRFSADPVSNNSRRYSAHLIATCVHMPACIYVPCVQVSMNIHIYAVYTPISLCKARRMRTDMPSICAPQQLTRLKAEVRLHSR